MSKVLQTCRRSILPPVDRIVDGIGLYTTYQVTEEEIIGSTNKKRDQVIDELEELGYEYNGLSATKIHPETNRPDDGSFRRVLDQHPDLEGFDENLPVFTNWRPNECQFHVHVFEVNNTVHIGSHYEVRPDILRPALSVERLQQHYRPTWNQTYLVGAHEDSVANIIE